MFFEIWKKRKIRILKHCSRRFYGFQCVRNTVWINSPFWHQPLWFKRCGVWGDRVGLGGWKLQNNVPGEGAFPNHLFRRFCYGMYVLATNIQLFTLGDHSVTPTTFKNQTNGQTDRQTDDSIMPIAADTACTPMTDWHCLVRFQRISNAKALSTLATTVAEFIDSRRFRWLVTVAEFGDKCRRFRRL